MPSLLGFLASGGAGPIARGLFAEEYAAQIDKDRRSQIAGLMGVAASGGGELGAEQMGPPTPATGGTGLLGALADPADRARAQFAAGLMSVPGMEQQGGTLMREILGRDMTREAGARDERRIALNENHFNRTEERIAAQFREQQDFARERYDEDRARWGDQFALERLKFREQSARGAAADARGRAADERDRLRFELEQRGKQGPAMGSAPQGSAIVAGPDGVPRVVYLQGSKEWRDAREGLDTLDATIGEIDQQLASISQSGTEVYGAESKRQGVRQAQIVSGVAKLRGLGVLQPGELENIEASLPNPSTFRGAVAGNKATSSALKQLRASFVAKRHATAQLTQDWPGFGDEGPSTPPPPPGAVLVPGRGR
jgi:hypothetical protein